MRLLPLILGLTARSVDVHVMTAAAQRDAVEDAGGHFIDVFGRYPVEAVDRTSIPVPSRLVTHAAAYADPITDDVAALRPDTLIYDSFFVAAPLVGRRLGIPYVGMRAGHAQVPARAVSATRRDPRVRISKACLEAVERLRDPLGMPGAHPFSYLEGLSPYLNLCAEPPEFLTREAHRSFEPTAYFGSLAPEWRDSRSRERPLAGDGQWLRVYISFGTTIWTYYAETALAALRVLVDSFDARDVALLVSLGNYPREAIARPARERPRVRFERYVDQWGALQDADLFVTQHGLSSTHEAIFHQVPMLSYPFFGDQPEMARRCQELGLAIPLSDAPRAPLLAGKIESALADLAARRESLQARLAEARDWELETIHRREGVLTDLLALG